MPYGNRAEKGVFGLCRDMTGMSLANPGLQAEICGERLSVRIPFGNGPVFEVFVMQSTRSVRAA